MPQSALYSGIPIPVGDNVYALMRDGKEIFRGSKKEIENVASHLKTLKEAEVLKYLDELIDIKQIDEAIKKLNINITIPKNTLNYADSIKKIEGIISLIKNRKPPKHFDPDKDALKVLGIKLKPSKRGLCADFNGTKYLYPAKGNEKNIVKIKLTGDRKLDDRLAYEISHIKKNKDYSWHHLDDYDPITNTCTMQLVSRDKHIATIPHFGAVQLVKQFFNLKTYK
ncbi:HNH endonuclease [Flavobacterium sp.]|uniref:HNH endonuclease n=1 Tax=Flavobacterium sp. TaxID=239 RepID=UPI0039E303D3